MLAGQGRRHIQPTASRERARRIWLANVGANSSHSYSSPLFPDGTFEVLPIVETPPLAGPHSVRFADLRSFNDPGTSLARWVPERLHNAAAHFDPEFLTYTYGDNCATAPRAAALKNVQRGDLIFFVARLARWERNRFSGEPGFFLVGFLEVDSVVSDVRGAPRDALLARVRANAHIRRGLNDPAWWNGFWVFAGTARSNRFRHGVPVDRDFVSEVLRDARGGPWRWNRNRSELQTIGSYTRSCRCIIDESNAEAAPRVTALRQRIKRHNPDVWPSDGF
ncbi:MAG: hypothetical protein HY682_01270 [Chloroflexi bacterium]|nr:hypothetical protein [Chloroflexota bacterium]